MRAVTRLTAAVVAATACSEPSDILYEPEPQLPVEIAPGLTRLTVSPGPDYVRGVTADGRVIYLAAGLVGGPTAFGVVSMDPNGGSVRQEAGAYATVLPGLIAADYYESPTRRTLLAMNPPGDKDQYCGDFSHPAPAPAYVGMRLYTLPPADGAAFSALPQVLIEFPLFQGRGTDSTDRPVTPKLLRFVPALWDADSLGTRAAGPAISASGEYAYISDMETVTRLDLVNPQSPPVAMSAGAYPLLSASETELFVSRPVVSDSVARVDSIYYHFFLCVQVTTLYTVEEWQVWRLNLTTSDDAMVGIGAEPSRLGDSALVVRRADGLYVLRLQDGVSTLLVDDATATSPAVAPDGSFIAFTSRRFGNPDIFVLRLN